MRPLIFHQLSVILLLDKGDCPENLQIVYVIINKRSCESFMCLDSFLCYRPSQSGRLCQTKIKVYIEQQWRPRDIRTHRHTTHMQHTPHTCNTHMQCAYTQVQGVCSILEVKQYTEHLLMKTEILKNTSRVPGPNLFKIIIMAICKAPTLRLKALNKRTHIMYIEMENVIQKIYICQQVFKHNDAKDAHAHTFYNYLLRTTHDPFLILI